MSIRTRRLQNDYDKICKELAGSDCVSVQVVSGEPPSHYRVTYNINGLIWDELNGNVKSITEHVVDIHLPLGYPRQAPRCTMKTPIWHPNVGDYVCIGDYWSAGVTLVDIIAHIGNMIQYRSYNIKSPVSRPAAEWAERNIRSFPVGDKDIIPPQGETEGDSFVIEIAPRGGETEISLGPIRARD